MENELKTLGLTDNEIKVYSALLDIGENTVGPLVAKLGMHRQVIYDTLAGLEKKNMVGKAIKQGGRQHFHVSRPENILADLKKKQLVAETIIPQIENMLTGQKRGQEIKVYEGEKSFRELMIKNDEKMPPGSETLVVSSSISKYLNIMSTSRSFIRSNRLREKKNITTKYIFNQTQKDEVLKVKRPNMSCRFLAQGYNSPVSFQVWSASVSLVSYGSDVFVIEIENQDFLKTYTEYFNLLWNIAKE
ncbi:MAG: hypothetical protein MUC28_00080 [Planctomycetes bacterium]|nr:hypothetical protein [Planctomycetota bacterium]